MEKVLINRPCKKCGQGAGLYDGLCEVCESERINKKINKAIEDRGKPAVM